MGAPSDDDDRKAAPIAPLDAGWSAPSPAHNDRTTAGMYVDPASVGRLTAGKDRLAPRTDHDRTKPALEVVEALASAEPRKAVAGTSPGTGSAPNGLTEDSTLSAFDKTMEELERASSAEIDTDANAPAPPDNDQTLLDQTLGELAQPGDSKQTQFGMGVATQRSDPGLVLLEPGKGMVTLDKQRTLEQPERSPLAFVMRDMPTGTPPPAPAKPSTNSDSSRFVVSLMGAQMPPRVEAEAPVITAMEPVLRRSRQRRKLLLGALAATVALGTAGAVVMANRGETPRTSSSETAKVSESAAPVAEAAAATIPSNIASNVATPAEPAEVAAAQPRESAAIEAPAAESPTVPAAKLDKVALATRTETRAKPVETEDKPAKTAKPEKKSVALKDTTDKKSATEKKSTDKKSTDKKPTKSVAKTSSTTKTSTAKKSSSTKTTAKKATEKKTATATAKSTTKKPTTAKKPASVKKPATEKKPATKKTTAKKTATKKSPRSQRSSRRSHH